MRYFLVAPEVAGELGDGTVMDASVHPPRVSRLHYEFTDWLGDDLLESFPCYVVTDRCRAAIEQSGFSGCTFAPMKATASDTFLELHPGRALPGVHWLKVSGTAGRDDFGLSDDHRLTVSERVLDVLEALGIEHAEVEDFTG